MDIRESVKEVLSYIGIGCGFVVIVLFGLKGIVVIPDTAHVVVESATYTYEKCVSASEWDSATKITVAEAKILGIKPNKDCRDMDGFTKDTRLIFSLLGHKPKWEI